MEPVSSVTAFVLRYLGPPEIDPEAGAIVEKLHPIERRVLELLACVPGREQRRERLVEQTGEAWGPARYDRIEARALRNLGSELTRRGWLQA
jgi:hypothetical protein